jgi:diacylglycerol kinase (ATP)
MNRKIIYLLNPISGTGKKDRLRQLVEAKTQAKQIPYVFLQTDPEGKYLAARDLIETDNYTDVVAMGGDGTVRAVVHALRDTGVRFGILPIGSGNGLARSAQIPMRLKSALQLVFEGHAKPIDAFWVNDQFSCMLSGLGFDAQVAYEFAQKQGRGLLTYTQQSIIQFFKAIPHQFEVVLPGFRFFTDAFFISVANSNQFGNNATIAPVASLTDGLLDVVIVQKMSKAKLPFAVWRQMRGNNQLQELVAEHSNKNILYFQTPSLEIRNPKLAPLHIDGDPVETAETCQINIIPAAFQLICPKE